MKWRLRFICLGSLSGLLIIYLIIGALVVSTVITPVRFYLNHIYFGLLPTYQVSQKAKVIDEELANSLTFNYNQKIISIETGNLAQQSIQIALSNYLDDFANKSIWQRWIEYNRSLKQSIDLTPVTNINMPAIIKKIENLYNGSWPQPQPAKLVYDEIKKVHLIPAKDGYVIDETVLAEKIKTYLSDNQPQPIAIPLKFISLAPEPTKVKTNQNYAQKLIKTKINLQINQIKNELTNQEKIALLSFYEPIDESVLNEIASAKKQIFDRQPKNALFQYEAGRVKLFKPSQDGFELDTNNLKKQIKQTVMEIVSGQTTGNVIINVVGQTTKPQISTLDSNDYGIKELVGQGESWFAHSITNRVHNIALAASRLNGILIAPGEVFSFNKYLGGVSASTGYKASYVIKNGKTILGDGGGVCQVSTTLFRAILNAGLPIVERHPHSYRVSYYEQKSEVGLDATVYAPYVDFKFKNDLKSYLLIQTEVDKKNMHLVFKLYGTKDGRQVKLSRVRIWDQSPPPPPIYQEDPSLPAGTTKQIEWAAWGAKTAFDWTVTKDGQILFQKTFYSAYRPWRAVYLRN